MSKQLTLQQVKDAMGVDVLIGSSSHEEKGFAFNPLRNEFVVYHRGIKVDAGQAVEELLQVYNSLGSRTAQEIVDQTNALARELAAARGWSSPEGYRFDEAKTSRERGMWIDACIAQRALTETDPDDAISELEDF